MHTAGILTLLWFGGLTVLHDPFHHLVRTLETFRSLGIEFISLSEQTDTSAPSLWKQMYTSPTCRETAYHALAPRSCSSEYRFNARRVEQQRAGSCSSVGHDKPVSVRQINNVVGFPEPCDGVNPFACAEIKDLHSFTFYCFQRTRIGGYL